MDNQFVCSKHGMTRYHRSPTGASRCIKCRKENVQKQRQRNKDKLIVEFGGACQLCGYNKYAGALHFHHKNLSEKSFALSGGGIIRSYDKLLIEAKKCILLCANCHAEVHAGIQIIPV